ncbi:pyridoxal phosphate-dependent decarboxylase family protein [Allorhizobium taibaishanense]|uniref:L-2,4-diaminobutyrate decarboxylase n=1 Tax=Allorhizobium taibaishanense TaxID=887144 RepID=A0A1Q9A412_9HYPH|nr:pyridoxal-dependent decarboxylase [Allorhizobium taibaishanense]MBB4006356.1 L-2,4-diaminobutyrate decarboxylase [Allorhizobium taibaishanense]OLP49309.1 hypothetical protein BJF91_19845 [Allorhizobium taibaishanense]
MSQAFYIEQTPPAKRTDCHQSDPAAIIKQLYDSETFRLLAQVVVGRLSDHLEQVQSRNGKVMTARPPRLNLLDARAWLDAATAATPSDARTLADRAGTMIDDLLANSQRLHHPGYIGHQLAPPLPLAAVFELAAALVNQGMAIYELGPWTTAVEKAMVERLGEQLGFVPGSFSGLVTSGGTLANLTALIAARNKLLGDAWSQGLTGLETKPVVITHMESHYSIARAAGIIGLGAEQCLYVASDAAGRTDPQALADLLDDLKRRAVPVIAVVASAGATRTGSFDPLPAIADLCEHHGIWLHVDAAHGGAVSFSKAHRHLIEGIERADSVIWDAHKMLFVPTLSTYLFYKNPRNKYLAFSQDAPFLFVEDSDDAHEFDCGLATAECTKRAAALSLWAVMSLYGGSVYETLIDRICEITALFVAKLAAIEQVEMPVEPQFNIVLFRYVPERPDIDVDAYNKALRAFIVEDGSLYLTTTTYRGALYLRFVVMNPLSNETEVEALIEALTTFAARHDGDGDAAFAAERTGQSHLKV